MANSNLFTKLASVFLLLVLYTSHTSAQVWGNGTALDTYGPSSAFTTRYWDCCKPSCGWTDHGQFKNMLPVKSCDKNNAPLESFREFTGCQADGKAYACANNSPWAVNDTFSYGFVGAHMKLNEERDWCCGCYALTFTTGSVKGKSMIVQAHNTDYEMNDQNIFTFAIPGGNTSYAGACAAQYRVSNETFGELEVGFKTLDECDNLPKPLQAGCRWRFDWFKDAQAPMVEYKRVTCPKELTDITGCIRVDEDTFLADAARGLSNKTSSAISAVHGGGLVWAWGFWSLSILVLGWVGLI